MRVSDDGGVRRPVSSWHFAAVATAMFLGWQLWPLLLLQDTLFFRDLGTTHLPALRLYDEIGLARMNPYASFGQPYLGNPNLLVAYRIPIHWTSLEWHLILHWLLGLAGMAMLLRSIGSSKSATFLGVLTFSFSGYVLSSLSFLNATTTIGWAPWIVWLAITERPRAIAARVLTAVVILSVFLISGEPAVVLLILALAFVLAARHSLRRASSLISCTAVAVILTLPIHYQTWIAARDSVRIVRGFSFTEAAAQSLHPARLVESVIPGIFGAPSKLLAGAWWGYRFSGGAPPYVHSVALLFVPLILAVSAGIVTRGKKERLWWFIAAAALTAAMFGRLPFASEMFELVPPLRFFRYPVKFFLLFSLAITVLAARAYDYWWGEGRGRIAGRSFVIFGVLLFGAFAWTASHPADTIALLERVGWNDRWASPPAIVLSPIAAMIPRRLLMIAAMSVLAGLALQHPQRHGLRSALLLILAIDAVSQLRPLLPSVGRNKVAASPLVRAASQLRGPICELAWKDLDPVRSGLRGRYSTNDAAELAVAQARQAWALSGAPHGIRYAYNNSPDGSYTFRSQLVLERMQQRADWDLLLKWFRASGVAGVIAPSLGPPRPGISVIAQETTIGIPARLFRIDDTLPPVRRVDRVVWVSSTEAALTTFEEQQFDERTMIVVEGGPHAIDGGEGDAQITRDSADRLRVRTQGEGRSVLFVARTYTTTARALVNGAPARVFPANVHCMAVPVPAGASEVVIAY